MKRVALFFLLTVICLGLTETALARQSCDFNIVGTWKQATTDVANPPVYHFTPDGTLTVLSRSGAGVDAETEVVASATYKLDDPKAPKSIELTAIDGGVVFAKGTSSLEITRYDDVSFTCVRNGAAPTRWVKVDPNRYFIILAARSGEFFDRSGSAFPLLVKMAGRETQIDAVGTYSAGGKRAFGPVPRETYQEFMREPRTESEVMLRLEINAAQYERGLKILREWERRVKENALLYPARTQLNNVLLVKSVAETLNQCGEEIKLYKLNYLHPEDWISEKYPPPFLPFNYFKELRRLNESQHVRDEAFPKLGG
ncbi:MAG: hypothetical protein ABW208_25570 [Pyrinomonadaceae bacterium]